jgi:beta-lactamase regulating signal transducer with metallopeptidase domain
MNVWMSQTIVHALGWTLVHFLWEGLVIAALHAVGLRIFKKYPAHYKYLAGCAAMALMAIAPAVTLFLVAELNAPQSQTTGPAASPWTETTGPAAKSPPSLVVTATPDASALDFSRRLEMLFPWLVLGWVAGVCALSGRLLAGWLQVRRLRRTATQPLPPPWPEKLAALAQRLGVNRSIQLLQSALIEVPTVIGWLRPVILLPIGCVTGLTPRQLESIIAHELAHIRRHDYVINLLQSAVETLLFYHPAVWWVSRRVRDERENCCDDLAVEVSGDLVGYARALATLEELRPASAQLMLAAGGAPLLQRIRRLAGQPERSAGRASWPVAGISLLLVLGILAAGMREHRVAAQGVGVIAPFAGDNVSHPPVPDDHSKIITLAQASGAPVGIIQQANTNPVVATSVKGRALNPEPEIVISAKFVQITSSPGETNFMVFNSPGIGPRKTVGPVAGVLTDPQFRATINALQQKNGTEVLAAPQIVTESGRQAQMQIGDVEPIVFPGKGTNASTTNKFFGITLDAVATVSADKKSISMLLIPSISKFLGYVNVSTNGSVIPMPHFELRQTTANVTVWDCQTVVIGGMASDSTNAASQPLRKETLLFVTAWIINHDGTRYNSDEKTKALWAGPPLPQGSTNDNSEFEWNVRLPEAPPQASTNR